MITNEKEKQIVNMYVNDQMSMHKIALNLEIDDKTVKGILIKNNVKIRSKRKYKLNEHYFDKIDTPTKAYILGFFYADGSINLSKSTIAMSLQEEDGYILDRMRREFNSTKELEFLDYSNKHDFGYTYKNQYRLLFFSIYLCKQFEKLGVFQNKSLILEFPDWLNKDLIPHFIRGYYDGDGSVCFGSGRKTNCILTITSTNKFCSKIKEIIEKELGINTYIADASNHNEITKVFGISGSLQVKKFLDYIYKDADIYLVRKYLKYVEKYYNSSSVE